MKIFWHNADINLKNLKECNELEVDLNYNRYAKLLLLIGLSLKACTKLIELLTILNFVKMKNLEEFGVQEMNTKEIQEIDGGIWPILGAIAAVIAVGAAVDAVLGEYQHGWNNPR
ncbi:class IIb bacteriocin, lactobin A/cerein 7B family [Marinifilum fragile]|uniref:class IIb bacteriocin, lactobin A/cerein 7B family n=1 Tax=Marinifilum fragile TaxID=570161 RepID=UPI002AA60F71|nr:class IIb bacteriocin, lactobin A/cerein 7B family [Marinifilum fragile]